MNLSNYAGLGALSCACQNPGNGLRGYGMGYYTYLGNGMAQDSATGVVRPVLPGVEGNVPGAQIPESMLQPTSESVGIAGSVPGGTSWDSSGAATAPTPTTSIGEDISSGIKSFFGVTTDVTKTAMQNPLLAALAAQGIASLVPGQRQAPPPPPPPSGPSVGTIALVGLGGAALVGVAIAASSGKKAERKENPRRRRNRRFRLRRR